MRLPCLRCFLILLLISAEVDDTWAGFVLPISVPEDDDEYLPAEQQECREQLLARHTPAIERQTPRIAHTILIQSDAGKESTLVGYARSLSLYVLMSLQR